MERKYFNTSFGKISYIERPGKKPIIFLHGLGGTGNSWTKLSPYLPDHFRLIFIDLLGHGHSEKPELEYTIGKQVQAIREFIENNSFEDIILMGNSYGGWISLRFTIDQFEPKFLILEDSAGINHTFGELPKERRDEMVNGLMSFNRYNQRHVLESIMRNNKDMKWRVTEDELRSIKCRTLLIWGEDDSVISPEHGRKLNEFIRNSKLVEMKGVGHVPHIIRPEEIAQEILEFLK